MAKQKREDLRVRRTKRLLSTALYNLIKRKPFEKITVCDICEEAMVHRATFYAHFSDKEELLVRSIDEHLPMDIDDSNPSSESSKIVEDIINYISENKEVYFSILKKDNAFSVSDKIQSMFSAKLLNVINERIKNGTVIPVSPEFWADFYAGACITVVQKWISGERDVSKEVLIDNLNTLLHASYNV